MVKIKEPENWTSMMLSWQSKGLDSIGFDRVLLRIYHQRASLIFCLLRHINMIYNG